MERPKKLVVGLLLAVFLVVGFVAGQTVRADSPPAPAPGSVDDPLVTKSYVDQMLGGSAALVDQIKELQSRVAALESKVAVLEQKLANANANPPGNQTNPATEKKVYVRNTNNYVNLREGPSTGTRIIGQVYRNIPMTVIGSSGGWYNVRLPNGAVGWVYGGIVELR